MELNSLFKTTTKQKKRLGLGHGSGRVKTAGRGTKGQLARGRMRIGFEGGQLPLIRRLPYKKGFKSLQRKSLVFNIPTFNFLDDGTVVDPESMVKWGFVPQDWVYGVKILGDGKLEKKITVKNISCSKQAVKKIEEAGGKVEILSEKKK